MSNLTATIEQLLQSLAAINEHTQDKHPQIEDICEQIQIQAARGIKERQGIGASGDGLSRVLSFHGRSLLVDNALGVMGFGAPLVSQKLSSLLVDTLVSLLLSSIACGNGLTEFSKKASMNETRGRLDALGSGGTDHLDCSRNPSWGIYENSERVLFGSSLSYTSLQHIGEICAALLSRKTFDGPPILQIVHAVLKVASVSSSFKLRIPTCHSLFISKPILGGYLEIKSSSASVDKLLNSIFDNNIPLQEAFTPLMRFNVWRLRPDLLKEDLSHVIQEALQRPLLSLRREFQQRVEWKNLIVGLALAPEVFREARRLLHTWFLDMYVLLWECSFLCLFLCRLGVVRLWDVRTQLVSAVLDVLDRPSAWGVEDAGVRLPPLRAFYLQRLRPFVKVLSRPPTVDGLVEIVDMLNSLGTINLEGQCHGEHSCDSAKDGSFTAKVVEGKFRNSQYCSWKESSANATSVQPIVGHDSIWALLIDFLPWLRWATKVLFQGHQYNIVDPEKGGDLNHNSMNIDPVKSREYTELGYLPPYLQLTAASYVAWVVYPFDRGLKKSGSTFLARFAGSWGHLCHSIEVKIHSQLENENRVKFQKDSKILGTSDSTNEWHTLNSHASQVDDEKVINRTFFPKMKRQTVLLSWDEILSESVNLLTSLCDVDKTFGSCQTGLKVQHKTYFDHRKSINCFDIEQEAVEHDLKCLQSVWQRQMLLSQLLVLTAVTADTLVVNHTIKSFFVRFLLFGKVSPSGSWDDPFACDMCMKSNVQHEQHNFGFVQEPAHQTEGFRDFEENASFQWCPSFCASHASALLDFVEDVNAQNFKVAGCQLVTHETGCKLYDADKLVETVMHCLHHWSTMCSVKDVVLLKDLKTRYCSWIDQLKANNQTSYAHFESLQCLNAQIASLEAFSEAESFK